MSPENVDVLRRSLGWALMIVLLVLALFTNLSKDKE